MRCLAAWHSQPSPSLAINLPSHLLRKNLVPTITSQHDGILALVELWHPSRSRGLSGVRGRAKSYQDFLIHRNTIFFLVWFWYNFFCPERFQLLPSDGSDLLHRHFRPRPMRSGRSAATRGRTRWSLMNLLALSWLARIWPGPRTPCLTTCWTR